MATCYRHPNRETNVACSHCGRPICPDCMTSTPVGMRCPECSRQSTKVHRAPSGLLSGASTPVTYGLIAACVAAFVAQVASGMGITTGEPLGDVFLDFGLIGYGEVVEATGRVPIGVAEGEYYRIISGGFLHSGLIHLALNMLAVFFLGMLLERAIGGWRLAGIYFVSLLGGSLGALILSPNELTVGASGAVFGLMAAAFILQRARGIDPMASGIGPIILINLVLGFVIPNVSIGGHIGGLVGGAIAAFAMEQLSARRRGIALPVAACVVVGLIAAAAGIAVSGRGLPS